MRFRKHPLLKINKLDFCKSSLLTNSVENNFNLPPNKFPYDFYEINNDYLCAGYFVSYGNNIKPRQIIDYCKNNKWEEIVHISGDFFILYCDFKSKRLCVLTDQTGKFPCYFSSMGKFLVLSTSFIEVVKSIEFPTLDIGQALDYISRDVFISDRTIINEVCQIPPGVLFEYKHDGSYSLNSVINLNWYKDNFPDAVKPSLVEFSDDFVQQFARLIQARLQAIKNLKFAADLSSGFDSSLVCYLLKKNSKKPFTCYSRIAEAMVGDTDPDLVSKFARKHDLTVKFLRGDHVFPFSTPDYKTWLKFGPSQMSKSELYRYLLELRNDGNAVYFTGEGGDEVLWSNQTAVEMNLKFSLQQEYFYSMWKLKYYIDRILSKKGLEIFLDRKRFGKKKVYPTLLSPSAINSNQGDFAVCWEAGVWPITPFIDPYLVGVAMSMRQIFAKQEIFKNRLDIFIPEQFREKQGPENQIKRYLTERPKNVTSILKNSRLGEKGWIKAEEIVQDIKNGKVNKYFEGDSMSFLLNVLELEYFLQVNDVKVET